MKKILPLLLFAVITSQAQLLDAVAIDVEGQAITTLEIQLVQKKMNVSKKAAVEALIRDRLEKAAIENAGITIDDNAVQNKINDIAASKNISKAEMRTVLQGQGLSWNDYVEKLKINMKKERFFQEHILATITQPSNSELEAYYNNHRDAFSSAPTQMSLVAYKSNSAENLKQAMANPMQPVSGVTKENLLVSSNEMSPALLNLINQTQNNTFTPAVNTQQGFVAYFVNSKGGGQSGFAAVKNAVLNQWMQEQKVQASKDFLNKLKSNAKIRPIHL